MVCSEIAAGLVMTNKSFLLYKTENEVLSCWDMLRVLLTFMCFIFTSCFCTTFTLPKLIRLHNLNTEMLFFFSEVGLLPVKNSNGTHFADVFLVSED